jgi:hypothetical protein
MGSKRTGIAVGLLGLAAAVVLFVALRDDNETTTVAPSHKAGEARQAGSGNGKEGPRPKPSLPTIVVRNGEPVGGVKELSFPRGGVIRFTVESDVADEVHLHGYDVAKPVKAGGKVSFAVPAEIDGVFEVELEERVVPLAEVTVNPG